MREKAKIYSSDYMQALLLCFVNAFWRNCSSCAKWPLLFIVNQWHCYHLKPKFFASAPDAAPQAMKCWSVLRSAAWLCIPTRAYPARSSLRVVYSPRSCGSSLCVYRAFCCFLLNSYTHTNQSFCSGFESIGAWEITAALQRHAEFTSLENSGMLKHLYKWK